MRPRPLLGESSITGRCWGPGCIYAHLTSGGPFDYDHIRGGGRFTVSNIFLHIRVTAEVYPGQGSHVVLAQTEKERGLTHIPVPGFCTIMAFTGEKHSTSFRQ